MIFTRTDESLWLWDNINNNFYLLGQLNTEVFYKEPVVKFESKKNDKNELVVVDIDLIKSLRYEGKFSEADKLINTFRENNKKQKYQEYRELTTIMNKIYKMKKGNIIKPYKTFERNSSIWNKERDTEIIKKLIETGLLHPYKSLYRYSVRHGVTDVKIKINKKREKIIKQLCEKFNVPRKKLTNRAALLKRFGNNISKR